MSRRDLTIVLVISLGSFMAGLDATIVNIALPSIAKYFNVSTVTVSWVLNAYLIVMVSLLLAASRLGDMKGYRNIFLIGFFLFTLGSMFCGIAPNIRALIPIFPFFTTEILPCRISGFFLFKWQWPV